MNVLITGATGYIGFNVAQAFRRAGHSVIGLVIQTMISASQASPQPKTVNFTSGCWVYGNSNGKTLNVYGKREGMLNLWFDDAYHGRDLVFAGSGYNHWPLVHVGEVVHAAS